MADFAVDSSKREQLVEKLTTAASEIERLKGEIYKGIDGMEGKDSWTGTSYNSFKTMCHSYENALTGLHEMLNAFSKVIGDQVTEHQDTLEEELHKALD